MSMKALETAILNELHTVLGNNKLRKKDILEWSTGDIKAQDDETKYFLPVYQVYVVIKTPVEKPKKTKKPKKA